VNISRLDVPRSLIELDKADCAESLAEFVKHAWHVIEPGQPYMHGWHIDFMAAHLEAITDGVQFDDGTFYNRLLINVPPGAMKSLLTSVFWPAWVWGPRNEPHKRFLCASHSQGLAIRDSTKMRRLIVSDWYQARWGDRFKLTGDQNAKTKFENTATGFREAIAAGSITGARGDIVIIDDPHSVESAASDAERANTLEWFTEAVPNRMNNPERSAIVVIMQRLHQEDVSGIILDRKLGYDHVMLPMRYDPGRAKPTMLGFEDPRSEEGELLFPARFPLHVVDRDEGVMGPYATASQHQQTPEPRGGGIIKRDWWVKWEEPQYPHFDYVVAALDTAYTAKAENDPSAMLVFGVWSGSDQIAQVTRIPRPGRELDALVERQYREGHPKVMLIYAWTERLELHELVEKVRLTMSGYKEDSDGNLIRIGPAVDNLLIENKAAGHSVAQELRRIYGHDDFGVQMYDPKTLDKMARLYSVQHLFADGLVHTPPKQWAEMVIGQCAQFPRSKHDDLVDCVSMGLKHLRDTGILLRHPEYAAELDAGRAHHGAGPGPLYPG
jgi:predicted phage terminase large subunit-like protein